MELKQNDVAMCILICGLQPTCQKLNISEETGLRYLKNMFSQEKHPLILKKLCEEIVAACYIIGVEAAANFYNMNELTLEEIVSEEEKQEPIR